MKLLQWGALGLCLSAGPALADPMAEIAGFSSIKNASLNQLAGGFIDAMRGPEMNSNRAISVESVFMADAPLDKTVRLLTTWSAVNHQELKVYAHGTVSPKPAPADFQALEHPPQNSSVAGLLKSTEELQPDNPSLQLSKAEAEEIAAFRVNGRVDQLQAERFWEKVLFDRANRFNSAGVEGIPPYTSKSGSISPAGELHMILKEKPAIAKQFAPILSCGPLASLGSGGGAGAKVVTNMYWEIFDVEGQGTIDLGSVQARQLGESWQLADCQFFSSGGYFSSLTLYQAWPVTVNGKTQTLIWRGDYLSSNDLVSLTRSARTISANLMLKEIKGAISCFQEDARK